MANIPQKELPPIILVAVVWGPGWRGQEVEFKCYNLAIVSMVNSGHCHELQVVHQLRGLAFFAIWSWLPCASGAHCRVDNIAADALSRNNMSIFFSQSPEALNHSTVIPKDLQVMFLHQQSD